MSMHTCCVWLFVTPWTVALQSPLSMGFSQQEYWRGLPCPPPADLPIRGIEPVSLMSHIGRQVLYHERHLGSPAGGEQRAKEASSVFTAARFTHSSHYHLSSTSIRSAVALDFCRSRKLTVYCACKGSRLHAPYENHPENILFAMVREKISFHKTGPCCQKCWRTLQKNNSSAQRLEEARNRFSPGVSGDCAARPAPCFWQWYSLQHLTDAEARAPILWPPDAKGWLTGKDPDAGKD